MAIKSSGSPNPPLSFTEIEAEFGQNNSRSLGDYRITQSVGQLSDLPLDNGIPQGNAQIAFSDFYSKRLNIVVDCFSTDAQSGGVEESRVDAKTDKWNNNKVVVIGGGSKKEAGSKIIIHVNKKICSIQQGDQATQQVCALKTGNWNNTSNVQVDLGSSTEILGAGGNGGKGQNGISQTAGMDGLTGNSALGIESDNAIVNVGSGAVIRCGFGGGGGTFGPLSFTPITIISDVSVFGGVGGGFGKICGCLLKVFYRSFGGFREAFLRRLSGDFFPDRFVRLDFLVGYFLKNLFLNPQLLFLKFLELWIYPW